MEFKNWEFENSEFKNLEFENSEFEDSEFENSDFGISEFEYLEFENSGFENSEFENLEFETYVCVKGCGPIWLPVDGFLGIGLFQNMFEDLLMYTNNFCFGYIALFCFFETFLVG